MKKGYQRLLIFEMFLFAFLFLNSFVWNILDDNVSIILLFVITLIFKFLFGLEKDRHRYIKDIIFDLVIILLVSFLLYYLFGILIGFYRVGNYYNWYGFRTFIIPSILLIIFREFLRYQILNKSEGSNLLICTTTILFILLDISTAIYYEDFATSYDAFMFVALVLLPSVSRNIVSSYICMKVGYKPNIIWMLVLGLYSYLIPIIPNPNEYILAVIRFVFPFVILGKVYTFFEKTHDYDLEREYKKRKPWLLIFPTIIVIVIVYFTSGYFKYYAIAIATGSMKPAINKGDVVVIEKIEDNFEVIKKGQTIAFKHDNVTIVHRVINIVEENDVYYFYTKGDANNSADSFAIYEEDIVGIVNFRIPFIGLPTVWLNEL